MRNLTLAALAALAIGGCAAQAPAPAPAAQGDAVTGEVWVWDEQRNIVTMRQGDRLVHVQVTPDVIAGLRPHQVTTVRGRIVTPDIERFTGPAGALVPRGGPERAEVAGTVGTYDPAGKVSIETERGPVMVWVASQDAFRAGDRVRVKVEVQPLDVVQTGAGGGAPAATTQPPAGAEPGQYAVVTGPVTVSDGLGRLTVQTPRGPIVVPVAGGAQYRVGDWVEVRTSVHPAR